MTKTFITVVSNSFTSPFLPVILLRAKLYSDHLFGILNLGHWDLPFDLAQGGEPVEPFGI